MPKLDKYAQDGVNVAAGDSFSSFAGKVCVASFENSRFVEVRQTSEHFRGPRRFRFINLPPDTWLDASTDGIGTKVGISTLAEMQEYSGWDLLAMSATDLSRFGGLPLIMLNDLNVSVLGEEGSPTNVIFRQAISGLGVAAAAEHIVLWRGETAELGKYIGGVTKNAITKYVWGSTVIGLVNERNEITGDDLEPGQVVMALRELSLRSNGISSVPKALQRKFGKRWIKRIKAQEFIRQAATPSCLYAHFLAETNGWYDPNLKPKIKMHAIAHISGGGIVGKFGEDILFPRGLSAELTELFDPPDIMRNLAEWRGFTDEEIYSTWNGGQGILAVIDEKDVNFFITWAHNYFNSTGREGVGKQGVAAKEVGRITITKPGDKPRLLIKSRFSGKNILFYPNPKEK